MTQPTPPKPEPAGDVAHVHGPHGWFIPSNADLTPVYFDTFEGAMKKLFEGYNIPVFWNHGTPEPFADAAARVTAYVNKKPYTLPEGALVPLEEKELQSNPQSRKEGDEPCQLPTSQLVSPAADERPIPSSGGKLDGNFCVLCGCGLNIKGRCVNPGCKIGILSAPRATATPLSDKQWTTPFTLNDDILRRWYGFARTLETQLAETRAERDVFTQADSSKTDWCPCCKQGWHCSEEDQRSHIALHSATTRAAQLETALETIRMSAEIQKGNSETIAEINLRNIERWATEALATPETPTVEQKDWREPKLARIQPCGCIICKCEDPDQCHGCGAKHCGTHPVAQIPNPIYESHLIITERDALAAEVERLKAEVALTESGECLKQWDSALKQLIEAHNEIESLTVEKTAMLTAIRDVRDADRTVDYSAALQRLFALAEIK